MISKKERTRITTENNKKIEAQNATYDPIKGIGSPIKREKLHFSPKKYIYIPSQMCSISPIREIQKAGSVAAFCRKNKLDKNEVENAIIHCRIAYDFEYWCASCVKVQDKMTKMIVPLLLRPPQLKFVKLLMERIEEERAIRIILLKARQWGGSTVVQMFMAWIQLFHREGWHSVIVGDIEDQARNIKSMYSRLAAYHPKEVFDISLDAFEGSTKNRVVRNRGAIIYLGSMQKPDALRSADVMMAHLSEVGLWRATEGKQPEDIVQSIAGTVPLVPYSMIVMESTAKGVGNYFHREWIKATTAESGYEPLFVGWWEISIYQKPFSSEAARESFINSLTDSELLLFDKGATLEGLHWFRHKKHTDSYDDWRMACEFPSTPEEAFQSTGRHAHVPHYINAMRKHCKPPKYKGYFSADATFGKAAIDSSLHFHEDPNGELWLWALPEPELKISNRYIVSMDIGGRTKNADWSVISIIDRYWMTEEGVEECIGTYRFHIDQDIAVWRAVQTARFFDNALLVVEANSLDNKGSEGDHTLTILDEIKHIYPNLYCRTDPQRIREGYPERYGFHTSCSSKTDLVNQMNRRFREELHYERDARALDEANYYEIKEDGTYGAVQGEHDDIYMSRAIGLKASQIYPMPRILK